MCLIKLDTRRSEVAKAFGVSWGTAWEVFESELSEAIEDPDRIKDVVALGVDETSFLSATKDHSRIFSTGMVDVRRGILCDVIEGRSARILSDWLQARPESWLEGVEVVTIDPLEAYRCGLKPSLEHALVVADPFHMVRVRHEAPCLRRRVRDPPLRAVAAVR